MGRRRLTLLASTGFPRRRSTIGRRTSPRPNDLKALEEENAKLKKLLAKQMLDAAALRSFFQKMVGPAAKRASVADLQAVMSMLERRACSIVSAGPLSLQPPSRGRAARRDLANQRRRFGYRRLVVLLQRDGEPPGIYRLYRGEGLAVRKRRARRKAVGIRGPILVEGPRRAVRWTLSTTSSPTAGRFRILNIVDDVTT